jgi:hypothetical protein
MKCKINYWIPIIGFLILVLIWLFSAACGIKTSVRHSAVRSALAHLPVLIEVYRVDKGVYPTSLDELVASESKSEDKDILKVILNDQWKDHYEYQSDTNGFKIVVSMPHGWFVKKEQFERDCKIGEALK